MSLWYDHVDKPGGEFLYAREQEVYLGMCRRWREMPADHRHGPGRLHRRRPDAGLGVRFDRGQ